MKNATNSSQELRSQIRHLVVARESLQKNIDISGSMVNITRTLNNIRPLMTKQTQYIKNFLQGNQANDQSSKESETRRYISRISQIILNQINEVLSVAERYFTLDIKTSWTKLKNQFQKKLIAQRQQIDKNNFIQFLFKIYNMKEKIMKEFLKSLVYRKCLLWKDLNIVHQGFVHSEKKKITKSIEDYITNKKYAPTRPQFNLPDFNCPGQWSLNKQEVEDSSVSQFFKLISQEFQQLFSTVRNYSGLNEQQRDSKDIRRNESQVTSLRGQIEQSYLNYQILQRKYREAVSKDQKLDIIQMKEQLKIAEEALQAKDLELRQLKYSYRDYTRDMNMQKQKIKELQADLEKITNLEMKKLKEVELLQFGRIHKNMGNFGSLFQFESDGKKSLAKEIISLKETIEKMAIILGRHKNENHHLKQEMKRLNLIIIQLGLKLKQNREKGGKQITFD